MNYADRRDAGKRLANTLQRFKSRDTVVMALPRGGIVVGAEVAKSLRAPLGLVLVRKIGHPAYAEYAIAAITENSEPIYNQDEVDAIDKKWLKSAEVEARELLKYRRALYFDDTTIRPKIDGKVVVIVDDGIATGLTMEAAVRAVGDQSPRRIIVAVPVASTEGISNLKKLVDEVIVLNNPDDFTGAVGSYYDEFDPVKDDEVQRIIKEHKNSFNNKETQAVTGR